MQKTKLESCCQSHRGGYGRCRSPCSLPLFPWGLRDLWDFKPSRCNSHILVAANCLSQHDLKIIPMKEEMGTALVGQLIPQPLRPRNWAKKCLFKNYVKSTANWTDIGMWPKDSSWKTSDLKKNSSCTLYFHFALFYKSGECMLPLVPPHPISSTRGEYWQVVMWS